MEANRGYEVSRGVLVVRLLQLRWGWSWTSIARGGFADIE